MDWSIHDADLDEDGFIVLRRRENNKDLPSAFSVYQTMHETKEIVFHHGYVAIHGYRMGDNKAFEHALSIWDKIYFKYRLIGGYYVEDQRELRVNRGVDFHFLQKYFPDYPCRVQNDAIRSRTIDIDLLTPPRSDFQKAALAFMASQGTYESKHRYTQQLIDADTGDGKSTPDDTMVPTPNGLVRLDQLKVGDEVFNVEGHPVKILKIFPQKGLRDTYEVTFMDGRTARCSPDHLWTVYDKKHKCITTIPLKDMLGKVSSKRLTERGTIKKYRYWVSMPGAVRYHKQPVPVDPYVLGALIGNGCFTGKSLSLSSGNMEVPKEVSRILGCPTFIRRYGNYDYNFIVEKCETKRGKSYKYLKTKNFLKDLPELIGLKSGSKYIPDIYKYNSRKVRWAILQGLMDTDGNINKKYRSLLYSTTSTRLKDDIVEIIRSLGYSAHVSKDKRTKYISGVCYNISISCPNEEKPKFFRANYKSCTRARHAASVKSHKSYDMMCIRSIRKVEPTRQRCILIDDPRHIYLTENFIPTHNTYCGTAITAFYKKPTVIIVPLNKLLKQWKDSFVRFTTVPEDQIMTVQGSKQCMKILKGECDDKSVYIFMADTIASFQKTHGDKKTAKMLAATGAYTKIVDEVHRDMKTITMIEALSNFHMNYYMSASPDRSEQKESWMFKTLFRNVPRFGSGFKTKDEKHLNIMIKKYQWLPNSMQIRAMVNPSTGLNTKSYERELIHASQEQRQSFDDAVRLMMTWSKKIVKPDHKIMILAQSIDTLYYLQRLVEEIFPGETAIYYGGMKPKDKQTALEARIIIATASSLGTGADIVGLEHVYNVSTYANKIDAIQISGRCRKLADGTPVVYCEFVNTGYYKTMRQYERRKAYLVDRTRNGKLVIVS